MAGALLLLLAAPASAGLVGLYTFDGANPLEAVIGSPAKEGVAAKNTAATLTDTMSTLSTVTDAAVLGGRTGVIAVPSYSTLAVPNPGLQKDWTIAFWFYAPANADWRCFFQFSGPNTGDGALFVRGNVEIGAGGVYDGASGIVGAWHQLVVSSANNTQTIWYDTTKLGHTRSWDIAGMSLLQFSLDNDGEDATMYFDEIRLYDETAPAEVFPDGTEAGPVLLDRWTESSYTDGWGSFSRTPDRVIDDVPYRTYVFSRHGSFTFAPNKASAGAEILVVGGGGAGGVLRGGGGGGGAVVHAQGVDLAAQTYAATVGAGGIPDIHPYWYHGSDDTGKLRPGPSTAATCGGASSVATASGTVLATAPGGGGGGNFNYSNGNIPAEGYGLDGASGGGAAGKSTQPGHGTDGLGHDGGEAATDGDSSGGGGGGAGAAGTKGNGSVAGAGGMGVTNSITGSPVVYGGGGGASSYTLAGGLAGEGGGGTGVASTRHQSRTTACNGVDGLGGGGGGGSGYSNRPSNSTGGRGGDGAVILRVNVVDDDDPAPTLAVVADPVDYTNATLTTRLVAFGSGASQATVSLVVSANQDLSDPVFSGVLATDETSLGSFDRTLLGLVTNTTYYAQATAVNDRSATGVSALVTFTTLDPAPAAGTGAFDWCGSKSMGATATLSDYGAGSSSAVLRLEASADGFESVVASAEIAGTTGESAALTVAGLAPATTYELRFRFVNEWGVVSYAPVPGSYETRGAPIATSGIGYRFSSDETVVDFSFGVTAVYDGATLSATLSYDGNEIGTRDFSAAGTLSWPGIPSAGKVATATVTVTGTLGGEAVSETWETTVTPGASARAVASLAELRATPVRPGDTIVLPELFQAGEHYLPLDMRSFKMAADGITLVALEPGFSAVAAYRYNEISGAVECDAAMGLAICAPKPEGAGRVFLLKPQTGRTTWTSAASWENLTGDEEDYPRLADDVAIAPMPKNQLVIEADVAVGAIYIGQDTSSINSGDIRLTGKNAATLTFERSSGAPGLLRLTGLARYDAIAGYFNFRFGGGDGNKTTGLGVEMPGGLDADCGDWPDITDTDARAKSGRYRTHMGNSVRYWNIPAGKTLRIFNVYGYNRLAGDDQGSNANFTWENNAQVTGSGTFLYDGVSSTYFDDPFYGFEGTVAVRNKQRYDGFSMGSRGGSFWMVNWTQPKLAAANASLLIEGDVGYNNGLSLGRSYGVVSYGNAHGYGSWGYTTNALPARKWTMNGGVYYQAGMNNNSVSWREDGTTATQPIRVPNGAETLCVSNGLSYICLGYQQGNDDRPTNNLDFARLEHAGDGVLVAYNDRLHNSNSGNGAGSSWRTRIALGGFHGHAIGGTGAADAVHGPAGVRTNILESTAPIVPWIVTSVESALNLYFPGASPEGELVMAGHPKSIVLDEAADPTMNVNVKGQTSLTLTEDRTVNSLRVPNPNGGSATFNLGAERTLTITSGGLVVGNGSHSRGGIGNESGYIAGKAGTIVFPNKAYIYTPSQNGADGKHAAIWAKIVSTNGAVFSYPGYLDLGGDQTGIDDHIALNGTYLRLGSATTGCEIDVPVHLHGAYSTLELMKAGSFCGQELWFWDHGTPGSRFIPAAGTTETVAKCYVDGVAIQRGTWGSSASGADHIDDRHFSGTGMIEVLADEMSGPDIADPEVVTLDDASATFSFDLWPGFGADSVEVYALATADGSGETITNLIYSSAEPADGRYQGTCAGLEPETDYVVGFLAVNHSGADTFATECAETVSLTTAAADPSPLVALDDPSEVGPGGATFPWLLSRAGSGRSIVSIRLYWAEDAAAFSDLATCTNVAVPAADFVPGNHATELFGLRPATGYYALLVAENDGAANNACTSGPVAFATLAENRPGARPLEIGSCLRTAEDFTAVVSAPAGSPAFPNVYAVWGPRHGGESVAGWAGSARVGALDESASFLTATIPAADLGDAVYVRFVGMADGGKSSWSASYYLPDIPVVTDVPPNVAVGGIAPGGNDVALSAYVFSAGSLSEDGLLSVSLEYALAPDAFEAGSQAKVWSVPFTNGVTVGAVDAVRIGNLRPERRYYARFVGVNDHGQRGDGDVFAFDTVADGTAGGTPDGGLMQQRVSANANVSSVESLTFDESKAALVEGAIMAYSFNGNSDGTNPYVDGKTGESYAWGANEGWLYKGYIFLEGGTTYTFGSAIDDSCVLWIDGKRVLRQADYNARNTYGSHTPETTGWFPIEIRMSNGTGGAGACNDENTFGLGFNTTGTKTVSSSEMARLIDPGDASLLRASSLRTLTVVSAARVANGVSATVFLSAGTPAGTLRAYWGAEDAGTNRAAWAGNASFGPIGSAATETTVLIPVADPVATPLLRLAVGDASGSEAWSELLSLDLSQPLIGAVSATTDGDRMTVTGAVQSLGSGNGYELRLLWGYAADLSDARSTNVVAAAAGPFSATVPVVPGTNGWWRLVATTSDGGYDATLPAAFKTQAGSVLAGAASVSSVSHHDMTVTGSLDTLGAGTTTVTLWYGEDGNTNDFVRIAEIPVTEAGTITLKGTVPGLPRTVYFQLRSENVAPGGTRWTSASDVFTGTTTDAATYTWKPEKTEGDWNDPENWTVSGVADLDDVLGYPNSTKSPVQFLDGTAAVVTVPEGTWYFQSLDLNVNHLDLRFVGEGAGSSQLYGNVWGGGNNSKWSGWTVVFDALTLREENTIQLGNAKSENIRLVFENGAVGSFSGWQDLLGTNTWIVARGGSRIEWRNGDGVTIRAYDAGLELDESTATIPQFCYERESAAGPQSLLVGGEAPRFSATSIFRTYDESKDPMNHDLDVAFRVPLKGWRAGVDAPVYASYDRGTDNKKLFAWRSTTLAHKVRLSVLQESPLVQSGHARTVQLVEWKAGIDAKNVELVPGAVPFGQKFAKLYYTYGWPSTRKTPESDGEIPTGVAADVTGIAATILILR